MNIKSFLESNENIGTKWKIDGKLFQEIYAIPDNLFNKDVSSWMVNRWENIIEITTESNQ